MTVILIQYSFITTRIPVHIFSLIN